MAAGRPKCANCGAALPWVADADDHTFAEVAERSDLPVLVDFWASWCAPCRQVSPVLERLAADFAGRVKLVKVDIDASPELARRFVIKAVPTLVVLDGAREVARQAGAAPAPVLHEWVEKAVSSEARSG